ncbi:MAG TPA: hypothetical protein VJL61_01560 [Rhodanobacteraceae bacterium]|jgi:hypothetical protein|nr:hypothetical protein [Rhodanobacteraceae bacterium]
MQRPLTFLLAAAVVALAGCSHSADRVPDYHTLLGKQNQPKRDAAFAKCNESSTAADRMTNPWCGVADKAETCQEAMDAYDGKPPAAACPEK